jgi:8-oxo-dGTP pyrophosphatase MutT (NUDIX family)
MADNAAMQMDAGSRERIARNLHGFEPRRIAVGENRHAAVALAVVEEGLGADIDGLVRPPHWSSAAALILTRRASGLRRHSGQWALPGGQVDAGESIEQAALRELAEEVGLHVAASEVLGTLDDFTSRSGFVISPVVVWAGAAAQLQANPDEVAGIHRIRIAEFMRADAPLLETTDDSARPILRMPVGRSWIAAPTAAILYQFRELCIAGRPTRVAHFDQPLFARR